MSLPDQLLTPAPSAPADWRRDVVRRVRGGDRFAGLFGTDRDGPCEITALLGSQDSIDCVRTLVRPGDDGELQYPSLTPDIPAAGWYERALHDLSGVRPIGHPRLDPLLLPQVAGSERPRPGRAARSAPAAWQESPAIANVTGSGVFSLPLGPVRSGVLESLELLIETPGEDIPYLSIRPFYKHRGVAKQFEGTTVDRAVLVAERVEGVSSVAHALAFSHAVETLTGVVPSRRAQLLRVIYAELERMANHLDVTTRLCDAAGLAVATSRFGWHKETVMRLVSRMCGSRFGRGVIVPGGVWGEPALPAAEIGRVLADLRSRVDSDVAALANSASFLDRLRTTGPLPAERAREHGALGPVGRGSGYDDDDRRVRPYDAYDVVLLPGTEQFDAGDAMARTRVRWQEISASAELIRQALDALPAERGPVRRRAEPADGGALGWAEAAQGEVLYAVEFSHGRVRRCFARSASFHNLVLLHDVFAGDIFTDLPFIEFSFGLSYAGVAM